jgi:uncharacterized membrane protein YraQ (UPF0718 family)
MSERGKLILLVIVFSALYFAPVEGLESVDVLYPGLALLQEYARRHVLTCLVPAFFIAGAIAVFLSKDAVLKYLGPSARGIVSYTIASLSGGVLAVCSCTVLPLFAGICKRGAGLGPAIAFVFTGPAVNITAIALTISVLGWEFALFRLIAAATIAVVSGMAMAALFERHETRGSEGTASPGRVAQEGSASYPAGMTGLFLGAQVAVLVVLGIQDLPIVPKVVFVAAALATIIGVAFRALRPADRLEWIAETWGFTKQIMPYLFVGIFLAGLITVFLSSEVVAGLVGGNGLAANAIASVSGALMYFATLTEIPILDALIRLGMGSGPAMALLLTGNALSLPNLLVLSRVLGRGRTAAYLAMAVSMSVLAGLLFGVLVPDAVAK